MCCPSPFTPHSGRTRHGEPRSSYISPDCRRVGRSYGFTRTLLTEAGIVLSPRGICPPATVRTDTTGIAR
uniref:helix-turn-helix domain-containing protein n=1 Tax=Streptomyces polyasparticus TaxID=2767826 RepID=UPI003F68474D